MTAGTPAPGARRRRGRARTIVAVAILLSWASTLTLLVRREYFVGSVGRLAEAALRISPGAAYFSVEYAGKPIGFASMSVDTLPGGIELVDYIIADLPGSAAPFRQSARSIVRLSRTLALRTFDLQTEDRAAPLRIAGRAEGDTAIVFSIIAPRVAPDSHRVVLAGPVLLPVLVPIAIALGDTPKLGRVYLLPMFNPATRKRTVESMVIRAESLFTIVDSASFDEARGEWIGAHADTVRAWRVEPAGTDRVFSGWIDAQGRVVQVTQPGDLTLRRTAYELAFDNWRIAHDRATAAAAGSGANDIQERTAIAAGASPGRSRLVALAVRLGGIDLNAPALRGGRQRVAGDTVGISRETEADLVPSWSLLNDFAAIRSRFAAEVAEEPLLQVRDIRIAMLATRIAGLDRDPRAIAEKINRWVYDSLRKAVTYSVPNALAVLQARKGDCDEHTQLFVALTRALGIPARVATGLLYVKGKFYYHAWPEVFLRDWVAVDPTLGQFPADASHIRFALSGLSRQSEVLRLIGHLKIQVLEAR